MNITDFNKLLTKLELVRATTVDNEQVIFCQSTADSDKLTAALKEAVPDLSFLAALKTFGVDDVAYADEHEFCCDCGTLIQTSATGFWDTGRFYYTAEHDLVCRACAKKDVDRYLEDYWQFNKPQVMILKPGEIGYGFRVQEMPKEQLIKAWRILVTKYNLPVVFDDEHVAWTRTDERACVKLIRRLLDGIEPEVLECSYNGYRLFLMPDLVVINDTRAETWAELERDPPCTTK